jgi:hypothetical protein
MKRALHTLVVLLAVSNALGSTLTVNCTGGGDYSTISEAVAAAGVGDTLLVAPCTYYESVEASELGLTFVGSGADITRLEWSGVEPTLLLVQANALETTLSGIGIANAGSGPAIKWCSSLLLETCDVAGLLRGDAFLGTEYGWVGVTASDCEFADVDLRGGGVSGLTDCELENLSIVGSSPYLSRSSQHMILDSCHADSVAVGYAGIFVANGGDFGPVTMYGGLHAWPGLDCDGATLGPVEVIDTPDHVTLSGCELASLRFVTDEYMYFPEGYFQVSDCLIAGPAAFGGVQLTLELDGNTILGSLSCSPVYWYGGWFTHNTVLGDFDCSAESWWDGLLRSNIVMGETSVAVEHENTVITHNDFVGGLFISVDGDTVFSNFSADPLFCDAAGGDYRLEECSPCIGAAHDGGDVGAHGAGCACSVPVKPTTWGRLKAAYR